MSASALSSLYQRMAEEVASTGPALLRRITAWAAETRDDGLLAAVARHPQLPEDALATVAASGAAAVRIAYLTRPDRSPDELGSVLANESRVSVLAALAGSEAAPVTVLNALVEVMETRGARKIAEALALAPNTPPDARLAALELISRTKIGWQLRSKLREPVRKLSGGAAERAARTLPAELTAELLAVPGLSSAARLALIERLIGPALAELATTSFEQQAVSRLNAFLSCGDLQLDVLAALEPLLARAAFRKDTGTNFLRQVEQRSGGVLTLPPEQRTERLANLVTAEDRSCGPAELAELAAAALAASDAPLAARLSANPGTPPACVDALVALLDPATATSAYAAQNGAAGRDAVRVALIGAFPQLLAGERQSSSLTVNPPAGALSDFDDPAAGAAALVGRLKAAAAGEHDGRSLLLERPACEALLIVAGAPCCAAASRAAALALPWPVLQDRIANGAVRYNDKVAAAAGYFSDAAEQTLTSATGAWVVFEQLAEGFTGSVGELLESVAAVAS